MVQLQVGTFLKETLSQILCLPPRNRNSLRKVSSHTYREVNGCVVCGGFAKFVPNLSYILAIAFTLANFWTSKPLSSSMLKSPSLTKLAKTNNMLLYR